MIAPDFANGKLNERKVKSAIEQVEEYLLSIVVPQVPMKTGQLRDSYRINRTTNVLGPANTTRKESDLTNFDLAGILKRRGLLDIYVSDGERKFATTIAKRALGGRDALEVKGRVTLG